MKVELIARPNCFAVPSEMGLPRKDQLDGPDGQVIIELAGRACYDSLGKGRNSSDYAAHIKESGHGSVLEHAAYSFFISGVSRGLTHELVRHRVGVAISQRSTRYVDESESPWATHPLLEQFFQAGDGGPELQDQWTQATKQCQSVYDTTVAKLQEWLIERGVDKATARKQARGAARGVLGNALETSLVWTANVRTLRTMLDQRASAGADAEIRKMAMLIYRIMSDELPVYFEDYVVGASPDGVGEILTTKFKKI